jgi:hypothetical protein
VRSGLVCFITPYDNTIITYKVYHKNGGFAAFYNS